MEKRKDSRIQGNATITVYNETNGQLLSTNARLRDIGPQGIAIKAEQKLIRHLTYHIHVDLAFTNFDVIGRVLHVTTLGDYFIYGIRIESVFLFSRGRFNRFLCAHSKKKEIKFLLYSIAASLAIVIPARFLLGLELSGTIALFFAVFLLLFLTRPF